MTAGREARRWNRRLIAAGLALTVLTAVYLVLLVQFRVAEEPRERSFGDPKPAAEVLLQPSGVDPLNRTMKIAVYLTPKLAEGGGVPAAADRTMTLVVAHGRIATDVTLAAGGRLAVSTFETDLEGGRVADYPLDAYRARLGVELVDASTTIAP